MKDIGWHVFFFTMVYLVLHLCQNYSLGPEFVRYHLKDFILIPMLMFSISIFSNLFNLKFPLGNKEVIIAFIYCVFAFELVVPAISKNQTPDWRDILAYALGASLYLGFYKQASREILVRNYRDGKE